MFTGGGWFMIHEVYVVEDHVMVTISGSIYVEEAAELRASLIDYIEKGYDEFIFDLSGVEYIDSTGLGTRVAIQTRALKKGGSVIIKGINGLVKEIFELTRLTKVFEIRYNCVNKIC